MTTSATWRNRSWSTAMYDMYPEWGPTRHEYASAHEAALQAALDLRDNGGQTPDDN